MLLTQIHIHVNLKCRFLPICICKPFSSCKCLVQDFSTAFHHIKWLTQKALLFYPECTALQGPTCSVSNYALNNAKLRLKIIPSKYHKTASRPWSKHSTEVPFVMNVTSSQWGWIGQTVIIFLKSKPVVSNIRRGGVNELDTF